MTQNAPEPNGGAGDSQSPSGAWVAGLLIISALIPIVGVVIGLVQLAKNRVGPGLAALVAAGLGFVLSYALFSSV